MEDAQADLTPEQTEKLLQFQVKSDLVPSFIFT